MRTSAKGRKLIEEFEGLYLHAYNDGVGVCTIGYGHTDAAGPPSVRYGMACTEAEADAWLSADLAKVERTVSELVKVPLTQNQFDVLVSFEFNTGGLRIEFDGALRDSVLLHQLNAGDYASVPSQLARWNRGGGKVMLGLTRRRAAEGAMWSAHDAPASGPPPAPAVPWWTALFALLARIFGGSK